MQAIAFCTRCRGMRVGWNCRYIEHCLICKEWITKSSKLLILTVFVAVIIFAFPTPAALVFSGQPMELPIQQAGFAPSIPSVMDPAVNSIESFLKGYGVVDPTHRSRVAESIVSAGRKHNLEPRLIASIVIVESRANPFAISSKDSIGIMQIHLPTWGKTADREGVNLFKIEDNIDFGARILRDYVRKSGMWDGVKRYKGWFPDSPESESSALEYVAKVQGIYGIQQAAVVPSDLLQ
jgi:hypothetical protein